jgi:hypothetical protein
MTQYAPHPEINNEIALIMPALQSFQALVILTKAGIRESGRFSVSESPPLSIA